ncbi:hypothetical protein ABS71_11055 [bacterium SCN 62-11]|nr:MAG: hypothetical protein ABS71_11055 [bacterium SCN 62-11]
MLATFRRLLLAGLGLRYRVRTHNLEEIAAKGTRGILFLPTHPANVEPLIVVGTLWDPFKVRPFADQDGVKGPVFKVLTDLVRAFKIPTVAKHGQSATAKIEAVLQDSIAALRQGDNVILYPAGRMLRGKLESVSGNSAVETIVKAYPEVRVVLVKTRGLWGSRTSLYQSTDPDLKAVAVQSLKDLAASGFFFMPKRPVDITFEEPADFPRQGTRAEINAYIENVFNHDAPPATYVPYRPWEKGGIRPLPEPERARAAGNLENVSPATRQIVTAHLQEMCGVSQLQDSDQLAQDLALDSLKRSELLAWLEGEFGFPQGNTDSIQTVADVLLAAAGELVGRSEIRVESPGPAWFEQAARQRLEVPPGDTLAACFLAAARRHPNRVIVADMKSGAKSHRDLITGILALLPAIQKLPGEKLGIMLPASVGASLAYLTTMFAGRTPVMINWTVGRKNLEFALELSGTQKILTARALVQKVKQQGLDLSSIEDRLVYLEDLGAGLTRGDKLKAFLRSRLDWSPLTRAKISPVAAILFTSGSETVPKGVPLTHANVLTDLRQTLSLVDIHNNDRLLGMLPPFHSFGLTINLGVPLTTGMRTVYHSNPTEGALLGQIVEAYKATVAVATPTFLQGILRASNASQLASLRLGVVGAEACPARVYDLLRERCPKAVLIEGYGITECSPIVALNVPEAPVPGTIGRLIPGLQHALVDAETGEPVADGAAGMLLLRGPSIFSGYLGDAPDPFVDHAGQKWYKTGDIVRQDSNGVWSFVGRLKRFIKLGGEMISLPAIESALSEKYSTPQDEGPILAVVASAGDHPELVLYTTLDLDREAANATLKASGLSALYNLRRVEKIEAIPILGTGKTDYRALQNLLH